MNTHTSTRRFVLAALVALLVPAAASAQDEGLVITEVQIGTRLESGLVAEPQTTISRHAGRIYAVVRLRNPSREATEIRVSFEHADGPERPGASLDIPARRRYRTVARFGSSHPPGRYRVVVRDAEGVELTSVEIEITQ
jgi:hypothetical protein